MHSAVKNGNLKQLKLLLINAYNVNPRDSYLATPLHYAVKRWSDEILIGTDKQSGLTVGFSHENTNDEIEMVKLLIQYGADVNAQNCLSETPLHLAVSNVYPRRENPPSDIVLFRKHSIRIIRMLLENGANVNARNCDNSTPLHFVFGRLDIGSCTSLEVIKLLLDHGADVNANDFLFGTPLHYAIKQKKPIEVVNILVDLDPDRSKIALGAAARKDSILRYLFEFGADITVPVKGDMMPLDLAVISRDRQAVRVLLDSIDYKKGDNLNRYGKMTATKNAYLKHLIRLKKANLVNLGSGAYSFWKTEYAGLEESKRNFEWQCLEAYCEVEVEDMYNELIVPNRDASYFELLSKPINIVANFVRLKDVQEKLKEVNWDEKFPEYADILQNRIDNAMEFASPGKNSN